MKSSFISAAFVLAALTLAGSAGADPVGGEQTDTDVLRPGAGVVYTLTLHAKETTMITVHGDGDGDIDCTLFDENDGLIDSDYSERDGCTLSVEPAWTGTFRVRLINNGDESSRYTLRAW